MPRWTHETEDRREQILDAAMHVFVEKGFARATNKDVAREAGITPGLIYYYFENKEALLQAVLETRSPLQVLSHIPEEMLAQPPEIFLPQLILRLLPIVEAEQVIGMMRVIISEFSRNPDLGSVATGFIQRIVGFLERYLRTQSTMGTIRGDMDFALMAQFFAGTLMGFFMRRFLIRDLSIAHYSYEEVAQAITRTMLEGIRPH